MTQSSQANRLSQAEWENLLPRLLLYANQRLRRLLWEGGEPLLKLSGSDAEDIVMQSVEQALSGSDPIPTGMSLFHFMRRIIDSNIIDTYERIRNQKEDEEVLDPPQTGQDAQEVTRDAQLLEEVLEQIGEDHRQILELMFMGYTSAEIAAALGVSERQLYLVKRRIRRKLSQLGALSGKKLKEA